MVTALAVGLAALALAALHYAFWTARLRTPSRSDELLFGETGDGWRIALGRRRPRAPERRPPVVLCHGVATNRSALDFGLERWSLAAHLARAGLDCFAVDLRGHGDSRRARPGAPRRWSFDTYLEQDVPAALEAVRRASGSSRVLWVGHSLGALLGMAACQRFPERIAGLVALAPAASFRPQGEDLRRLARRRILLAVLVNRFAARMVAPLAGPWQPRAADLALERRNVERAVLRRFLASAVEGIPRGVALQLAGWVRADGFGSVSGDRDYRAGLASCRQPALFVAAPRDGLAPPAAVEEAWARWGGEKRLWIAESGEGPGYGHTDLLLGRRAPEEVFPRIAAWLVARSAEGPARGAGSPPAAAR